ncbi:uroporphyrinogen-III synthase [Campylobacter suis]|uniref:Uroporphyrinogen-III synthase n=1 Tax=Campylobacter suis TaxID=2790657 RepID=A0ABM8Q7D9_9BACT|nr:uroporphyrinogen-III synthase [Campylobacter suis]CAD7288867.1 hypothetical protein LMG8286_01568 [Campylobacter suis]
MIYLIGSHAKFKDIKTLILNKIVFENFSLEISLFDALVITSKNSINALKFNQILPDKNIEIYAIGKASADAAKKFGFSEIYTAKNMHGDDFATEISPLLAQKKVLFLRAFKTASSVFEILRANNINVEQVIAYKNIPKTLTIEKKPPQGSILVFTAPSAVRNFKDNFGWEMRYKAVAIGNTTAKELQNLTTPIISPTQNLKDCIKLAKTLL